MRVTFMRLLPPLVAAVLAGCGGMHSSPLPQSPGTLQTAASPRVIAEHHRTVTCGTDRDNCKKIRLVAPLDAAAWFRGIALSLSSTKCAHARLRVEDEDDGLPLSATAYQSSRTGLAALTVAQMTDPCAKRDRHDEAVLHPTVLVTPTPGPLPGNTNYYVVALFQGADGSLSAGAVDGPANLTGTTLTFKSPVLLKLAPGTYAFYLATERADKDDE